MVLTRILSYRAQLILDRLDPEHIISDGHYG